MTETAGTLAEEFDATRGNYHTEGSWKVDIRSGCVAVYPAVQEYKCLSGFENSFIHFKGGRRSGMSWEMDGEDLANARLIAAAPDLLKAVKYCAHVSLSHFEDEDMKEHLLDAFKECIKKSRDAEELALGKPFYYGAIAPPTGE